MAIKTGASGDNTAMLSGPALMEHLTNQTAKQFQTGNVQGTPPVPPKAGLASKNPGKTMGSSKAAKSGKAPKAPKAHKAMKASKAGKKVSLKMGSKKKSKY